MPPTPTSTPTPTPTTLTDQARNPRMRTPTRCQIYFAKGGPFILFNLAGMIATSISILWLVQFRPGMIAEHWGMFLYIAIVGLAIGHFVTWAVFHAGVKLLFAPFYIYRDRLNGGPFKVGDTVQVIDGPYAGRISTVFEIHDWVVWIDLGPEARKQGENIFGLGQLLRITPTPTLPPTPSREGGGGC